MTCTLAIAPDPSDSVRSAVRAGGGRVVELEESPDAPVWMAPRDVDGLRQALSAAPSIRWVQLPFAGIERFLPSMAPEITWTCAKGVYSDDADALVEALRTHAIGGAALDVTDPEPLPAESPLWQLPSCLITPHTANPWQTAQPLLAARATENVRRFATGEELLGLVDLEAGY